ncbi:hypothetical protein [Trichothermofontia sp.]
MIKGSLLLPETEDSPESITSLDNIDETPEPESLDDLSSFFQAASMQEEENYGPNIEGRWFVSTLNPGAALIRLPGIWVKLDWRLVTYLYRVPGDGIGITWAVPEALSTTAQLESVLENSSDRHHPPQPKGALPDFMEALEGDRSPASFLVASIFRREIQELGRTGKSKSWEYHRLIDVLPPQVQWQWAGDPITDLSPKVRLLPDGKAAVEFFSCRITPPVAIHRHIDQYPATQYRSLTRDSAVAKPKR